MLSDDLPSEHPASDHRNLIGLQRVARISAMNQEIADLHNQGYHADADRVLDAMIELGSEWQYGAD